MSATQLITPSAASDTEPDWSPDRRKIAFVRQEPGKRASSLYVVRRDGGGLQRLTTAEQVVATPAWSGDGRRIAYAASPLAGGSFDVYVVSVDGGTPKVVASGPKEQLFPRFSDGKILVPDARAGRALSREDRRRRHAAIRPAGAPTGLRSAPAVPARRSSGRSSASPPRPTTSAKARSGSAAAGRPRPAPWSRASSSR